MSRRGASAGPPTAPPAGPSTAPRSALAGPRWLVNGWLPVLLALACFANSLPNGFTYDDNEIVRDNPRVRSLTNFTQIWLSDWWQPQGERARIPNPNRDRLYRPLTLLSFALNYAVHGLNPLPFHATNVALHALACWLVWVFVRRLLQDDLVAACAALLFAVHPVHVEAVANVVGRAEVLSSVCMLAGSICLLRTGAPSVGVTALAALAFLAALLAKETAICYPAVALLLLARRVGNTRPATWWLARGGLLLVPLLIYLPLRFVALEQHLIRVRPEVSLFNPLFAAELSERAIAALTILGHYTRLLLAPATLSCDYGLAIIDPARGADALTLVGLAALATVALALAGYRRHAGPFWRSYALLIGVFVVSYALISNTVLLIGVSLAERLLYWPSVPLCAALALLGVQCWRGEGRIGQALRGLAPLLPTAGALLLVALALRTGMRNPDWSNDFRLFSVDQASFPNSAHLNATLGRHYLHLAERSAVAEQRAALLEQAKLLTEAALRIYGRHAEALLHRGRIALLAGDLEAAVQYFEAATQLMPTDAEAQRYLMHARGESQPKLERLTQLDALLASTPDDVALRIERGRLRLDLGRHDEALTDLARAVSLAPDNVEALRLHGAALLLNFRSADARDAYLRVVVLDPADWEAHANLAKLLATDDPPAALRHAREAQRLNPNDLRTRVNLAEAHAANKDYAEALRLWRQIERDLSADTPFRAPVSERIRDLERLLR